MQRGAESSSALMRHDRRGRAGPKSRAVARETEQKEPTSLLSPETAQVNRG